VIANGRPCEILCSVRKSGVTATVDGRAVFRYAGDPQRLSIPDQWVFPHPQVFALGTYESVFHITKMEVKPISGPGTVVKR